MATFTRRNLLQASAAGLGGSLMAPFIRHVWAAASKVPRLVLVVEGNGIYARAFATSAAKAQLGLAANTDMILQRSYTHTSPQVILNDNMQGSGSLAALSGANSLVQKSAVVLGLSSIVAGGGHSSYQGGLACARGIENRTPAITIDAEIAKRLKRTAPFAALRLGVADVTSRVSYATCAHGPGRPAPIITSPTDAYNKIFSPIVGGSSQTLVDNRKSVLDFALTDVKEAKRLFAGSTTERLKLERYIEAIEDTQATQKRLLELGASASRFAPDPNPLYTDGDYTDVDALDRLSAQFDLATASLLGGLTNVVVLVAGPGGGLGYNYPSVMARHFTGSAVNLIRHDLQHGIAEQANKDAILDVTAEHVKLIANLARRLDQEPEMNGGGTMLDNTAILFMSDNGDQHHSEAKEWPMLLLGGKALGLKTDGRTVAYPGHGRAENRQVSNMFNTLCQATGDASMELFGQEGPAGVGGLRIAKGALDELFQPTI
jgi:Protein of unknown function (DUF1552)